MTDYVINEWLWADLRGENGPAARLETFTLLQGFARSPHRLILVYDSPFDRKAWSLCSNKEDMITQLIGRAFVRLIRTNLDRCRVVYPDALAPLPDGLAGQLEPDDRYLAQACLTVEGSVLVTTDGDLIDILAGHGLACTSREGLIAAFAT